MRTHTALPPEPILVAPALEDPSIVDTLLRTSGPYWLGQRYFEHPDEQRAVNAGAVEDVTDADGRMTTRMILSPIFRADWFNERALVDGAELIMTEDRLQRAARQLFGAAVVRPYLSNVVLTAPMPTNDTGHTDGATFRGLDRRNCPLWFLILMAKSGLFDRWRIRTATAVMWFYDGQGGAYTYWPEGIIGPSVSLKTSPNVALVGDNDVMFHHVEAVGDGTRGSPEEIVEGMTVNSLLELDGDTWTIKEQERVLATYKRADIRVSVVWKAHVFSDREADWLYRNDLDALSLHGAIDIFIDDLGRQGLAISPSTDDPLHDRAFVAALSKVYGLSPDIPDRAPKRQQEE